MNPKLRDRRMEMLRMHQVGVPITRIARELAAKYGVSRRTIESDFTRRDSWIHDVLGDLGRPSLIDEFLVEIHSARAQGWRMLMSPHVTAMAKVGVLRVLFNSIGDEVELLQSVGRMPKAPDRLQQEIVGTQKIRLADITESEQVCLNRAARILDEKMKKSYMSKDKDQTEPMH
jgi:hypothetical protein